MEALEQFEGHIPDDIRHENPNLDKFLKVLNGMLKLRKDEVSTYARNFLYPLVSDIRMMRRYVDEWRAEYTPNSSRQCIDCLYRSYMDIYSAKGTEKGLIALLRCLFWVDGEPIITIDGYEIGKPLILFDDDRPHDWLPTGVELAGELLATAGDEIWVPTLLDDTWLHQQAVMTVTIDIGYTPTAEFLEFIRSVIILYLPMINRDFIIINLNII